jgi:CspA family cold shock protein
MVTVEGIQALVDDGLVHRMVSVQGVSDGCATVDERVGPMDRHGMVTSPRSAARSAWSPSFSNGPCVSKILVREEQEALMATGTIKRVISDRGFGFIAADDEKEYFFHRDALDATLDFDRLSGGEKVEFDIEQSPKGPRASKVHAA